MIAISLFGCKKVIQDVIASDLNTKPPPTTDVSIDFSWPDHVTGWRVLADIIDDSLSHWRYVKDIQILPDPNLDSALAIKFRIWDWWDDDYSNWGSTIITNLVSDSTTAKRTYWFDDGSVWGTPSYSSINDAINFWEGASTCWDCFFISVTIWPNNGLIDSARFDFGETGNYYTTIWPDPYWVDTGQVYFYQGSVNP